MPKSATHVAKTTKMANCAVNALPSAAICDICLACTAESRLSPLICTETSSTQQKSFAACQHMQWLSEGLFMLPDFQSSS